MNAGSERWRAMLPYGVLIAAFVWQYCPLLARADTAFQDDMLHVYYLTYLNICSLLTDGTWALWNPFISCGEPHYVTHAWDGISSPFALLTAAGCLLLPGLPVIKIFIAIQLAATLALLLLVYRFFVFLSSSRGAALIVTLFWQYSIISGLNEAMCYVQASFWCFIAFHAVILWQRQQRVRYLYGAAWCVAMVAASNAIWLREWLFTLLLTTVLAWGVWRPPLFRWRWHIAAAAGVIVIAFLPKLIIVLDQFTVPLVRIGRPACRVLPQAMTAALAGQRLASSCFDLVFPFDSGTMPVNYPLLFAPLAMALPAMRRLALIFFALLGLAVIALDGIIALHNLLAPIAALEYNHEPLKAMLLILSSLLGCCGLARFLTMGAGGRAPGTHPLRLATALAVISAVLLVILASFPCSLATMTRGIATLVVAMAHLVICATLRHAHPRRFVPLVLLPVVGALLVGLRPQCPIVDDPLLFRPAAAPRFVNYRTSFAIPAVMPTDDRDIVRFLRPGLRGNLTSLCVWDISELIFAFDRPIFTQEPFIYSSGWRTRAYDTLLHLLPPEQRDPVLRVDRPIVRYAYSPAAPAVTGFTCNRLQVTTARETPDRLLVGGNFHPRWSATIDGQPVSVQPTPPFGFAVVVPAGRHQLNLQFRHPWFTWSVWLSNLVLLTGALWFLLRSRRRFQPRMRSSTYARK